MLIKRYQLLKNQYDLIPTILKCTNKFDTLKMNNKLPIICQYSLVFVNNNLSLKTRINS